VRELNHLTQTGLMNYVLQCMVAGQEERFVLVYAPTQKAFYVKIARRLYLTCREGDVTALQWC
jgi:hypothetical protein